MRVSETEKRVHTARQLMGRRGHKSTEARAPRSAGASSGSASDLRRSAAGVLRRASCGGARRRGDRARLQQHKTRGCKFTAWLVRRKGHTTVDCGNKQILRGPAAESKPAWPSRLVERFAKTLVRRRLSKSLLDFSTSPRLPESVPCTHIALKSGRVLAQGFCKALCLSLLSVSCSPCGEQPPLALPPLRRPSFVLTEFVLIGVPPIDRGTPYQYLRLY